MITYLVSRPRISRARYAVDSVATIQYYTIYVYGDLASQRTWSYRCQLRHDLHARSTARPSHTSSEILSLHLSYSSSYCVRDTNGFSSTAAIRAVVHVHIVCSAHREKAVWSVAFAPTFQSDVRRSRPARTAFRQRTSVGGHYLLLTRK